MKNFENIICWWSINIGKEISDHVKHLVEQKKSQQSRDTVP